jgi:hypothetical protein
MDEELGILSVDFAYTDNFALIKPPPQLVPEHKNLFTKLFGDLFVNKISHSMNMGSLFLTNMSR